MDQRDERARGIAPTLVGLRVEAVIVSRAAGLTLRTLPADGEVIITAEHLVGRIDAFVRDGIVVRVLSG